MNIKYLFAAALLTLLAACGGGEGDGSSAAEAAPDDSLVQIAGDKRPVAKTLDYTDPTGTGWRLVKDASSTPSRIVLNLVGPAGETARGVGFNLRKGKGVAFGAFATGGYAVDTGVFKLKGTNPNYEAYAGTDADPVLFVSAPLKAGDVLSTGIYQKDRTQVPKDLTQPLVQVAIELPQPERSDERSAAVIGHRSGDVIPLAVTKARLIPADIGGLPDFVITPAVIAKAKMVDIAVAVGTLKAQ